MFSNNEHFKLRGGSNVKARPTSNSKYNPTSNRNLVPSPTRQIKQGKTRSIITRKQDLARPTSKTSTNSKSSQDSFDAETKARQESITKTREAARLKQNTKPDGIDPAMKNDSSEVKSIGKTAAAAKSDSQALVKDLKSFKNKGLDFEYDSKSGKINIVSKSKDPSLKNATNRANDDLKNSDFNKASTGTNKAKKNKKKEWAKKVAAAGLGGWIIGDYIKCHVDDAAGDRESGRIPIYDLQCSKEKIDAVIENEKNTLRNSDKGTEVKFGFKVFKEIGENANDDINIGEKYLINNTGEVDTGDLKFFNFKEETGNSVTGEITSRSFDMVENEEDEDCYIIYDWEFDPNDCSIYESIGNVAQNVASMSRKALAETAREMKKAADETGITDLGNDLVDGATGTILDQIKKLFEDTLGMGAGFFDKIKMVGFVVIGIIVLIIIFKIYKMFK